MSIARVSCFRHRLVPGLAFAVIMAAAAARADNVTFELRIESGRVAAGMQLIRVRQDDVVNLRWSSDRPITLHLHGYNIETRVGPGAASDMTFTARATGRFSVEEHKPQTDKGHTHGAPIVRIEVHPR